MSRHPLVAPKGLKRGVPVVEVLPARAKVAHMVEWIFIGLIMSVGFVCSGLETS